MRGACLCVQQMTSVFYLSCSLFACATFLYVQNAIQKVRNRRIVVKQMGGVKGNLGEYLDGFQKSTIIRFPKISQHSPKIF